MTKKILTTATMKFLVLFFLLALTNSKIHSQEIHFPKERLTYFHYVNLAELAICKNNFLKAICYYDTALTQVHNPGYKDLYNLAICHRKIGNHRIADTLCLLLLKKGYRKQSLITCLDTIKNPIPKKIDYMVNGESLDEILNKIYQEDQMANGNRYYDMVKYIEVVIGNARKILSLAKVIDNLMLHDTGGKLFFPITHYFQLWRTSERVKNDSTFRKHWIVFRPLENINFEDIQLQKFLEEQVALGNYDRYIFASLLIDSGYPFNLSTVVQYNEHIIVKYPDVICENSCRIQATNATFAFVNNRFFTKIGFL